MKDPKIGKRNSEWKLEIHQLDVGQGDSALVLFKKLNEDLEYVVEKSITFFAFFKEEIKIKRIKISRMMKLVGVYL